MLVKTPRRCDFSRDRGVSSMSHVLDENNRCIGCNKVFPNRRSDSAIGTLKPTCVKKLRIPPKVPLFRKGASKTQKSQQTPLEPRPGSSAPAVNHTSEPMSDQHEAAAFAIALGSKHNLKAIKFLTLSNRLSYRRRMQALGAASGSE